MKNKLLSTLVATVMLFVGLPFLSPKNADAWFGTTTVYMTHRECIGTVWVGNTTYLAYDVTFFRETSTQFESWRTRGWTSDAEFGDDKRIQNMSYYTNMALSTAILNDANRFYRGYRNK